MFFHDRITGILPGQRVLDVGPGADPHPRADVLLEMAFDDPAEYTKQFGHARPLQTQKELVFYDGVTFPFADKSFDYVICSHVLEHVPDVPRFLSEVFRVGKRGYFEYPLAYYDLVYSIPAHVNFLKMCDGEMRHMKKASTHLAEFQPLHTLMLETMACGHTKTIDDLIDLFMEGFQWEAPFAVRSVDRIELIAHTHYAIPPPSTPPLDSYGGAALLRALLKVAKRRVGMR